MLVGALFVLRIEKPLVTPPSSIRSLPLVMEGGVLVVNQMFSGPLCENNNVLVVAGSSRGKYRVDKGIKVYRVDKVRRKYRNKSIVCTSGCFILGPSKKMR